MTANKGNISAKTIWGKVVLLLKEKRQIALHVACGDITDVELKEDKFIINVKENMLAHILEEGKVQIERAISWQGFELKVIVNLKEKEVLPEDEDIEKLKEIFDDLIIIDNKNWR